MSVINWTTILTALQNLFEVGSGLADTRVLFVRNGQHVQRPDGSGAWISLRFEQSTLIGRPYTIEEESEGTPDAGEEITERTVSHNRIVFTATCFPPDTAEDASTAEALLNDVILETFTPPRRRALRAAGIAAVKFEPVLRLDGVAGSTRFQPRATMMFVFHASGEKLTYNGYIETVNIVVEDPITEATTYAFAVDLTDE
jgi:hypothetical protein